MPNPCPKHSRRRIRGNALGALREHRTSAAGPSSIPRLSIGYSVLSSGPHATGGRFGSGYVTHPSTHLQKPGHPPGFANAKPIPDPADAGRGVQRSRRRAGSCTSEARARKRRPTRTALDAISARRRPRGTTADTPHRSGHPNALPHGRCRTDSRTGAACANDRSTGRLPVRLSGRRRIHRPPVVRRVIAAATPRKACDIFQPNAC